MLCMLMRRITALGANRGFSRRSTLGGAPAALAILGCAIVLAPSALAGETLRLSNTGLVVDLSDNSAGWKVMQSRTGLSGDLLARTRPSSPLISINVEVLQAQGKGCRELVATLNKDGTFRGVTSPAYLPSQYYTTALERTVKGGTDMAAVCAETRRGLLVASVVYDGSLTSADFRAVKPMLTALAQAGNNAAGTATPASSTRTVTLPSTGLTITVPSAWQPVQKDGTDGLVRADLDRLLGISLTTRPNMRSCSEWENVYRQTPGCTWLTRPGFLPSRYYEKVCDEAVESAHRGTMCLERQSGGVLLAQVLRQGPLSDAVVLEAKPILETIATAAKGVAPSAPVPTPAPEKKSEPAVPVTPPPSTKRKVPSSPPSSYRHDSDDDDDDDRDDWDDEGYAGHHIGLELGVHQLKPDSDAYDKVLGGTIGLRGQLMAGKGALGIVVAYNAAVGYQAKSNIPLDANAKVGPGIRVWRFMIAPVFGLGADSIAGGSPYKVYPALNYHAEAIASISIGGGVSVSGSAGRYFRTGDQDDPRLKVKHENRFSGQLNFRSISVGARFVNYESAKLIGGTFGLRF